MSSIVTPSVMPVSSNSSLDMSDMTLFDDLIYQLSLNTDYNQLKEVKKIYTEILHSKQTVQQTIKTYIHDLSHSIDQVHNQLSHNNPLLSLQAHRSALETAAEQVKETVEGLKENLEFESTAIEKETQEQKIMKEKQIKKEIQRNEEYQRTLSDYIDREIE